MKMKIWVDDVRPMPEGYTHHAYSVEAAVMMIESADELGEKIELIDLDHDAGDYVKYGGDYIRLLDYLENHHNEWIKEMNTSFRIHSQNVVGRQNMQRIIHKNGWNLIN